MHFAPDWQFDTAHLTASEPPPCREMFARWAWDLIERGEYAAGLSRAKAGVLDFPRYATGWYVLARAQRVNFKLEEAVTSAERCLSIEPDFYAAWALLVDVHDVRSHTAAARAARLRLRELGVTHTERDLPAAPTPGATKPAPRTSDLPVDLTKPPEFENAKSPARRLTLVRRAAAKGSFETPTLAEVYREQGLLDKALDVYVRILKHHPDDAGIRKMIRTLEEEMSGRQPIENA